jgi:shikimate 5-dehydrogenase
VAALATLGCQKVKFTVRSAALGAGLEVDVVGVSQVSQLTDRLGDAPVVVSTLPANALTCRISPRNRVYGHLLLDVVYAGWLTPLARNIRGGGGEVVSGSRCASSGGRAGTPDDRPACAH